MTSTLLEDLYTFMIISRTCEYGDELSGSIKCGEFLDWLQNQLASQEGLCTME